MEHIIDEDTPIVKNAVQKYILIENRLPGMNKIYTVRNQLAN